MCLSLIIICILLYIVCRNKTNKRVIKQYIVFITILLITVSGLRHEAVGNDTYAYMQLFDRLTSISWHEIFDGFWDAYFNPGQDGNGKDPGELVIVKALTYLLPDSRSFLFIVAAILLIPLGIFVYRNSESLETPCFFYVFYITIFYHYLPNSAVRQSLALALLLVGYLLLQKGKLYKFLICLFMATFLHKSIIIVLLLLPFYLYKDVKSLYKWSFVLFVIMLVAYEYIGLFLSMQSEIYEAYGTGTYYTQGKSAPFMVILMMLGLYLIGLLGIKKDQCAYEKRLIYGGAAMTLVWVVMVRLDPSIIRLTAYFGLWMGLMIPSSLKLWDKSNYRTLFFIVLLVFVVRAITTPDNYHFLWQEMQLHSRYL